MHGISVELGVMNLQGKVDRSIHMKHHFLNSQVANCTDLNSPAGESLLALSCGPSWALFLLYHLFSNAQTHPLPQRVQKISLPDSLQVLSGKGEKTLTISRLNIHLWFPAALHGALF